jgi:hypothetical protein
MDARASVGPGGLAVAAIGTEPGAAGALGRVVGTT